MTIKESTKKKASKAYNAAIYAVGNQMREISVFDIQRIGDLNIDFARAVFAEAAKRCKVIKHNKVKYLIGPVGKRPHTIGETVDNICRQYQIYKGSNAVERKKAQKYIDLEAEKAQTKAKAIIKRPNIITRLRMWLLGAKKEN